MPGETACRRGGPWPLREVIHRPFTKLSTGVAFRLNLRIIAGMVRFLRYRPTLQGFIGAPGINTWHADVSTLVAITLDEAQLFADDVRAAYAALTSQLGYLVTVQFPGEVTEHDEVTGELQGVHAVDAPDQVSSIANSAAGSESRATQATVRLLTPTVANGRRLQGRHFIGPLAGSCIGSDGQVINVHRNAIADAYAGLINPTGPINLAVWGPPLHGIGGELIRPGVIGRVGSVSVNSTPGTLRSRKV